MDMTFFKALIISVLCLSTAFAKPPSLSERDAKTKFEEILKAHACYHKVDLEIMQRAFSNYVDELDPLKLYLIDSEVDEWKNPTQERLAKAVDDYKNEKFVEFTQIHAVMVKAIERRRQFEAKIDTQELPQNVKFSEFKDLQFAQNEDELFSRLLKARSLQMETGKKLDGDNLDLFIQRVNKRRVTHEDEILGKNSKERNQITLAYALKSLSASLDSQTHYFTPSEATQFMMQVQQRLFGIGAQLRDDINGLSVIKLVEGSPAIQPGKLKVSDKIIAVDNQSIVGMDISEAVELIRGPEGTPVTLTILRGEEKMDIKLLRGEIVMKETRLETTTEPYGDGVIAILHLFSFYQDSNTSSSQDLLKAIQDLQEREDLKGIILDLRNNGGGLLAQAVTVSGLFMAKGVVVSVKDNTEHVQHLRNVDGKKVWDGPLIILTNRLSASAAEIVAQTLQDYGRAIVVGDKESYGKGTFQIFTLESSRYSKVNPKGEYKVTMGRYYTASGKSPQLVGVQSDIVVPGVFSEMEIGEKYAKYPLATDQIPPSFNDTLDDVPPYQRAQIAKLYKFNLQKVSTEYQPYIPILKSNSDYRQKNNKNYANFMKDLSKNEEDINEDDNFGQTDLQLSETVNIMKDLILLEEKQLQKTA